MDFLTSQGASIKFIFLSRIYQKNWDQVGILNNYFHAICYISLCSLHDRILVVILIDTYEN